MPEGVLQRQLDVIRQFRPDMALDIERQYAEVLLPAIGLVSKTREEEGQLLPARIDQSRKNNANIDVLQKALVREKKTILAAPGERLQELQNQLSAAHVSAVKAYGAAGASYNSARPQELPAPQPRTLETFAGRLGLPWPLMPALTQIPTWLKHGLALIIGATIGVGILSAVGVLHTDDLGANPTAVAVASLIGAAVVDAARMGIEWLWYCCGEYHYVGPRRRFWTVVAAAVLFTALILAVDIDIFHVSLIAPAQARAALAALGFRGHAHTVVDPSTDPIYWLAAALLTPGLLVMASVTGFARGQNAAVGNLLLDHQAHDLYARTADFGGNPRVQAAHNALGTVRELLRQEAALLDEIERSAAPFDRRWNEYEEARLPRAAALCKASDQCVEDKLHDAYAAQEEFSARLDAAKRACLPPNPFERRG